MNTYRVFSRSATDWKSFSSARKRTVRTGLSYEEALEMCKEFNNNRNSTQVKKGTKYEFERE